MNAMVSRETSVLDCSNKVPQIPNISPLNEVAVLRASKCSSLPPASWRSPSSRHCMPNRNSASPAHSSSQPELNQKLRASPTEARISKTMRE
ncbi:hypothetical protein D9M71_169080 [compost metagenome]